HILDRSESGVVQTAYAYIAIIVVMYGLGLDVAYLRMGRRDGKPDPGAFGGAFACVAAAALTVSALIAVFAVPISSAIGIPVELASVVRYGAGILAVDALTLIPFTELRGSHRAATFALITVVEIAMNLVLAYVFVR